MKMYQYSIRDKCRVNTNWDTDIFVGIKCENGDISVNFPLGYHLEDDEKSLRKDILLLMNTIKMTTNRKDSEVSRINQNYAKTVFPIQAFLYVVHDYYARGYYKEREVHYSVSKRGKIDWNKTIKTQKPYMQNGSAYYLDFVTKKNMVNEDEIITLIHEYCVFESFQKIGWLFTASMPAQPRIKFKEKLFRSVIREKIANTFNDKNRSLFSAMLAIVDYKGCNHDTSNYTFGTYRFEYVWEAMIDKVYGVQNKQEYFPKTYWNICGRSIPNASLEPDTIMVYNNKVYVLDAKYYKYGATKRPGDLPESTSINKQITYGEYIVEQEKFQNKYGDSFEVYNAFLMPFDSNANKEKICDSIIKIGEAYGDWKTNLKKYEKVQGILIDIKYLMNLFMAHDEDEIIKLVVEIERNM